MTVVDLYTIQIVRDGPADYEGFFPALMDETEENLTDLLPPGYRARIRRWNDPDPDEGGEAWETRPMTPSGEQTTNDGRIQ